MNSSHNSLVGKTVVHVEYDYNDALRLHFADGSMLYVAGVWHNDSRAGTTVSLVPADKPKSYEEDKRFYDYVFDSRWD